MAISRISADDFVQIWHECGGSASAVARRTGISIRAIYERRRRIESNGVPMPGNSSVNNPGGTLRRAYARCINVPMRNGLVVAFGDGHCRPLFARDDGDTLAMQALMRVVKQLQPTALLCLGDMLDGASVSRHPPLGLERRPTVAEEIGGVHHDLSRIVAHAPTAQRIWVVGNHDERFDRTLATKASEFLDIAGFSLQQNFPTWPMAWSARISDTFAVHRYNGGVHARWNNLLKGAGGNFVSGDTHRLGVTPYTGQFGTWYGVEVGTLADPEGPQFEYTRGLTPNWQQGFAVLTWIEGELQPPELCQVRNGAAWFRGEPIAGRVRRKAVR